MIESDIFSFDPFFKSVAVGKVAISMNSYAKDPAVKAVQHVLFHYVQSDIGATEPTGVFAKETDAAVKKFQKLVGITEDGIVGEKTFSALDKAAHDFEKKNAEAIKPLTYEVNINYENKRQGIKIGVAGKIEITRNPDATLKILKINRKLNARDFFNKRKGAESLKKISFDFFESTLFQYEDLPFSILFKLTNKFDLVLKLRWMSVRAFAVPISQTHFLVLKLDGDFDISANQVGIKLIERLKNTPKLKDAFVRYRQAERTYVKLVKNHMDSSVIADNKARKLFDFWQKGGRANEKLLSKLTLERNKAILHAEKLGKKLVTMQSKLTKLLKYAVGNLSKFKIIVKILKGMQGAVAIFSFKTLNFLSKIVSSQIWKKKFFSIVAKIGKRAAELVLKALAGPIGVILNIVDIIGWIDIFIDLYEQTKSYVLLSRHRHAVKMDVMKEKVRLEKVSTSKFLESLNKKCLKPDDSFSDLMKKDNILSNPESMFPSDNVLATLGGERHSETKRILAPLESNFRPFQVGKKYTIKTMKGVFIPYFKLGHILFARQNGKTALLLSPGAKVEFRVYWKALENYPKTKKLEANRNVLNVVIDNLDIEDLEEVTPTKKHLGSTGLEG